MTGESEKQINIPEGHWLNDEKNEKLITPEAKRDLAKFESKDDIAISYMELQKSASRPYKLPESLDKLPDDKTRGEFTVNTLKLLGAVDKEEALDDLDYAVGLPKDRQLDTALVGRLKKYAVEKHWPKSIVQDVVGLHNIINEETRQNLVNQFNDLQAKAKEARIKRYGSEEKDKEVFELIRRMFQNCGDLTPEEYEDSAVSLMNNGITTDPIIYKALGVFASKLVKEGTTETGEGGKPKEKPKGIAEQLPGIAKELDWKKVKK
jgi:hypothetical protein